MSDFNTSKIDGNTVGSIEWNQLADVDNLVISSGQTPSTSNLDQLAIASARYSSGGQFFTDSGTANAYVLSPVSPFKSPVSSGAGEGYFTGMIIRFRAGNANSGASTINVNSAGVKNLKKADGTDVATGDILTTRDVAFRYDGTNFIKVENVNPATATNAIQGISYLPQKITIANNTSDPDNDIDFSGGNFVFSDFSGQAYVPAMTKRLDANWTAGTNQGGLDTGTKANSTWYYCYAIYNPTTQASDFLFSASATSPTLPSGFTKVKYIGSILTNSSGNIIAFKQAGNYFYFPEILDANPTPTSGVYSTYTLSVPKQNNIIAMVRSTITYTGAGVTSVNIFFRATGTNIAFIGHGFVTNGYTGNSIVNFSPTNSLGQVDISFNFTAPVSNATLHTFGYIDNNL